MAVFTIKGFAGMRPIMDPRLLQPNEAQYSLNARLQSGALVGYKALGATGYSAGAAINANVKKIYPVLSNTKWLSWTTDVDVIESPIIDDQWDRLYWSGSDFPRYGPKTYVTTGAAPYPTQSYKLGIPQPTSAPRAVGASIADVATQTREYAVTYLNAAGSKESGLSLSTTTTCLLANYDYGLYDITGMTAVGTVVTATFEYSHDFNIDDYIKLTGIATPFKILDVPSVKTVTFDRGATAVGTAATTSNKRILAQAKLTSLPSTGNEQVTVTQKRIYRKVAGVYKVIATIPLATAEYEDKLMDGEVSGATIATAILWTPKKPTNAPAAAFAIDDESITTNAQSASPVALTQRVYAVAWLHDTGYESPLSESSGFISVVDGQTRIKVVHGDTPPDGCSKKRIYRQDVVTSGAGVFTLVQSSFKLLVEVPASQVSYTDMIAGGAISARAGPGNADGITPPNQYFSAIGNLQPTRSAETRVYVYTYVSAYGEEGPPSEPSDAVDIDPTFPVAVSNIAGAPTGAYNITKIYLYRTASTASGATNYQLVRDDIAIGTASTTDKIAQSALGELIPSIGWEPPPTDMTGLRLMANGIGIAFHQEKTILFSEPFMPHAYPPKYRISVDWPVVGIGIFGQSAVILTKAFPYIVSGVDPSSMTLTKLPLEQSCVSKRSIVETGSGIMYASPDGLVMISGGGANIATVGILSQAQWQAYNPSSIHGYWSESRYHGFYTVGGVTKMFVFDPSGQTASWCEVDIAAYTGIKVVQDDKLYVLVSAGLKTLFGDSASLSYTWRSKIAQLPSPSNLSFGQVQADSYPVTLKVIADDQEHTYTVASSELFRLHSGFLAREWSVEITGTANVKLVALAHSGWELKST